MEVATQLLLRSSSGVTPTEAGRRLAAHAEAIAAQLHAAEEELADITALRRGTVRFGTFPSAAAVMLPPVLARLSETRSEEHTSELQSRGHLVCRLLLEKKKRTK